jgi:rubredoxin
MAEYKCTVCGYIFDTEKGESRRNVAAGTAWEDVPADWVCPLCGVGKDEFSPA